jgi:hypothetical protein
MSQVLEIRMQRHETTCGLCGVGCHMEYGIPTYNGDVVSNDFPDELHRSGGGSFPVCQRCYLRHALGDVETFDHWYIEASAFGIFLGFDGGGI